MPVDLSLDKNLILPHLKVSTQQEVLIKLADLLKKQGKVKDGYKEAIIKREGEYPTGLPSTKPRIAIPHANYKLVNTTTLAIATLEEPVAFRNMENINETLDIQIVMMMAIGTPHGQVEMLQRVVSVIQDEKLRNNILAVDTAEEILNLVSPVLFKENL